MGGCGGAERPGDQGAIGKAGDADRGQFTRRVCALRQTGYGGVDNSGGPGQYRSEAGWRARGARHRSLLIRQARREASRPAKPEGR